MDGPPRSRAYALPFFLTSLTLFVLVVSAWAVVLVVQPLRPDDPAAGPAASGVDPCVVGTWHVVAHTETLSDPDVGEGEVSLSEDSPIPVVTLEADGTGATDYGQGTRFEGTVAGFDVEIIASGTVTFGYTTRDGEVLLDDVESDAMVEFRYLGLTFTEPLEPDEEPARYECDGDTMVQERPSSFRTRYRRAGS